MKVLRSSLVAALLGLATTAQAATLAVDLTTVNSGTIGGVTFVFDKQQPSGTGVLQPFLRVQNNGTEQGFNSDQSNQGAYPFDEKAGTWTHSVLFSSLQVINGTYNFVLDIGEPKPDNANQGNQTLLSLDGLKLFATSAPGQNSNSVDANGNANGIVGTLLWDMDAVADNYVLLDADRGPGGPGNGVSDMLMQVPTSVFANVNTVTTPYFILWSRFGLQNAANAGSESFGTFEEWAQLTTTNGGGTPSDIPEPGTLALLGLALAGIGLARRRS